MARSSAARISASVWVTLSAEPTIDMRKRSPPLIATMVSQVPSGPMKMKR